MAPARVLFHTLSTRSDKDGSLRLRGTIRAGDIQPGAQLFYKDDAANQHPVEVLDRVDQRRHVELTVRGQRLEGLTAGRFLFGP